MKTSHSGWIAPALALGLLGAVLYGYNENRQSGAALATLENQYQGAFHDSAFAVDAVEDALDKALVARQTSAIMQQLQDVVHYTDIAQADYGRLPDGFSADGKMIAYLGSVRRAIQRLLETHVAGSSFSATDRSEIEQLRNGAARVEQAMRKTQASLIGYHHVFATLAAVSLNRDARQRSPAWKQFQVLQRTAGANIAHSGATSSPSPSAYALSRQSAVAAARSFLHASPDAKTTVQTLDGSSARSGYLVTVGAKNLARLAVSPHGAVLWMQRDDMATGPAHTSVAQAISIARQYLAAHGIERVDVRDAHAYEGKATIALCPVVRGVMLFDEPVLVKVDLASGAVIGYDATEYLTRGLPLHSLKPAISLSDAKKLVSHGIVVIQGRLVVITSSASGERLAYELLGRSAQHVYRVFVDAQSGAVVDIQRLAKDIGSTSGGSTALS